MIYSKDDVLNMLAQIRKDCEDNSFFFKNDELPPKVVMLKHIKASIEIIEESL